MILKNNSCNNKFGYNIRSGGNDSFHSNESKIKMSISRKGKQGTPRTLETKIKISNGNKGKKLNNETKLKISNSEKGKIISEETRKNMSKAQTGKNNNFYGKKHTEEILIK